MSLSRRDFFRRSGQQTLGKLGELLSDRLSDIFGGSQEPTPKSADEAGRALGDRKRLSLMDLVKRTGPGRGGGGE